MRASKSHTTALIAGSVLAAAAMFTATTAGADSQTIACEPGQIVIDGQCQMTTPDTQSARASKAPGPATGSGGQGSGTTGTTGHH